MNPDCSKKTSQRQKVPTDGWGPHGAPECYYTSRVLDSTARYDHFVKKLRSAEEEVRSGLEITKKIEKDINNLNFFNHCARKGLIQKVADRVKLCLESYEEDLQVKRNRLKKLLSDEEENNVRLVLEHGQSGAELLWEEKMKRLAFLLEKRQKEIDEKVTDIPLDKCAHLHPCQVASRKRESRDIQLYQIHEKQMRKESEKEIDKMWQDLAMKESDALAARMEYDAMERLRRDRECHEYTKLQIEMSREKRAREQEILKQNAILLKADAEAYYKKQEEEHRTRDTRLVDQEMKEMIREREEWLNKQKEKEKLLEDTWTVVAEKEIAEESIKEERRRQIAKDVDECNIQLAEMRRRAEAMQSNADTLILQLGQQIKDATELKRCQYQKWSTNCKIENQKYNRMVTEGPDKEREEQLKKEKEYDRKLREQLEALEKHEKLNDAQAKKLHVNDLIKQMEYTKLLKEQAEKEEKQERQKCVIAKREYQEEIEKMICRPNFSEKVHPFLHKMVSGLQEKERCPCSPTPALRNFSAETSSKERKRN